MPGAPFPRRSAFPDVKGTKERVGIHVAQQEGGFVQFNGALLEIVVREFAPRIFHQLLKGDIRIGKPTL